MINAGIHPIFTSSAKLRSGRNEPSTATKQRVKIVDFHGVRNFSWIAPKKLGGIRRSRGIASITRGWLGISTRNTAVIPGKAPIEIRNWRQVSLSRPNRVEHG